ncbi:hypothetical protein C4D60_Mb09t17810 [Musa balbisiana]|uniref:Transmembrane protein n=1 Tax=Musa balbisiana TaxID=52838 RepID=A0A4S8IH54_MUSBA|nr:hypothetical protein C4D60_Mb09t17810 [Musa balbisiana]
MNREGRPTGTIDEEIRNRAPPHPHHWMVISDRRAEPRLRINEERRRIQMEGAAQIALPVLGIAAAAAVTFYAVSFMEVRERVGGLRGERKRGRVQIVRQHQGAEGSKKSRERSQEMIIDRSIDRSISRQFFVGILQGGGRRNRGLSVKSSFRERSKPNCRFLSSGGKAAFSPSAVRVSTAASPGAAEE